MPRARGPAVVHAWFHLLKRATAQHQTKSPAWIVSAPANSGVMRISFAAVMLNQVVICVKTARDQNVDAETATVTVIVTCQNAPPSTAFALRSIWDHEERTTKTALVHDCIQVITLRRNVVKMNKLLAYFHHLSVILHETLHLSWDKLGKRFLLTFLQKQYFYVTLLLGSVQS